MHPVGDIPNWLAVVMSTSAPNLYLNTIIITGFPLTWKTHAILLNWKTPGILLLTWNFRHSKSIDAGFNTVKAEVHQN